MRGQDARLQLLVSAKDSDGNVRDATREVVFSIDPPAILSNDGSLVRPLADGEATVTATHRSGAKATSKIIVTKSGSESQVSFHGRVVPIFTKLSCNSGGCHGKAAGQAGFRLSLLGFEPQEDYEHLVRESRGRRISPATPDRSLLLLKAINESPHGGGQRLEKDSHEYRLLRRLIGQVMPEKSDDHVVVTAVELHPTQRLLMVGSAQQLSVLAHLSDGSIEDVTRAAVYESNDTEMADVDAKGLVQLNDLAGDVTVMARYQGHVTVFQADIPQTNATPHSYPPPRNAVDTFVIKKLKSLGIPASPPCDDATFLRRVTLDIAGRLPNLVELQRFESDGSDLKRENLVDRLLRSPDHADYFAGKWSAILRNRRGVGELKFANIAFHQWIRDGLAANTPYDEFVRAIVAGSGSVASHPPVAWYQQVPDTNQRIEDAAQLFLGQRIQCARCHHHPYEKWSQADYTQMAAFFSTVSKKSDGDPAEPIFFARVGGASARHPKSGKALAPVGLDSEAHPIAATEDPRSHFAEWMTDPNNPFFAKSLVNRYWKHFMGRGLVEPEDDLRVTNPPSNPELMDAMANHFVQSNYDLRELIRLITNSQAYQFRSDTKVENLSDRRSYSRFYPKRLQAEVLLDSIDEMTGTTTRFAGMPPNTRAVALPDNGFDSYFLSVFGRPAATTACECERSQQPNLAQNLHLLNSNEMQGKLSSDTGRAAMSSADDTRTDADFIRQYYRMAFSRNPTDRETKTMESYIVSKQNRRQALEDILWSLINSKEFLFNH
ncbi:MAG: DUF1553 domain-containing protein [Rubripirellula sp.]